MIQGPIFCCNVYSSLYSRSYPHIFLGKCTIHRNSEEVGTLTDWLICSQLPSTLVVSTPPTLDFRSRLLRSKWIFSPLADGDGYWFSEKVPSPGTNRLFTISELKNKYNWIMDNNRKIVLFVVFMIIELKLEIITESKELFVFIYFFGIISFCFTLEHVYYLTNL